MHPGSLTFDAFLRKRASDRRLARLTHDVPLPASSGIEFGPAANPTALPERVNVTYVDHALDACDAPGAVAIDIVWDGSAALVDHLPARSYDFAIAAQVGQYVPNLLGWFRGAYAVLRPGGVLNMSLPDKRFMFDALRPASTIAELVEADLLNFTRPSPRQQFAHTYGARAIEPAAAWSGIDPRTVPRLCGEAALSLAFVETQAALGSPSFPSCHCWVFTPRVFLQLVEDASRLGLFPFVLNQIAPTNADEFEFFVSMRHDAEEDPQKLLALQLGAIAHLDGMLQRRSRTARLLADEQRDD